MMNNQRVAMNRHMKIENYVGIPITDTFVRAL